MRRTSILAATICCICFATFAQAQINPAFQKPFAASYTAEAVGKYTEAVSALESIGSAGRASYEYNLRMGWLKYLVGDFVESTKYYDNAIKIMPKSIEAKLGYVSPAAALENWDKVLQQYQDILNIDPHQTLVLYRTGLIFYARKDYKAAYSHFKRVVDLYPFDYGSNLYLGWCAYFLGNKAEATQLFNKVLLISPEDASAKEGLGLK